MWRNQDFVLEWAIQYDNQAKYVYIIYKYNL